MLNNIMEHYHKALNQLNVCTDETQYNETSKKVDEYHGQALKLIRDSILSNKKLEKVNQEYQSQFNSLFYQACSVLNVEVYGHSCISKVIYIPILAQSEPISDCSEYHNDLADNIHKFIQEQYGIPVMLKLCNFGIGHSLVNDPIAFNLKLNYALVTKNEQTLLASEKFVNEVISEENDIKTQLSLNYLACCLIVKKEHADFLEFIEHDSIFAEHISTIYADRLSTKDSNILCYYPIFNYNQIPQSFKEILFENRFVITLNSFLSKENVGLTATIEFKDFMTEVTVYASNKSKDDGLVYQFNHTMPYFSWQQALTFLVESLRDRGFTAIEIAFINNKMLLN